MKINHITKVGAGAILLAGTSLNLNAASIFTSGHGDIGVEFNAIENEFEPHWHMHGGAIVNGAPLAADEEYAPSEMIAQTSATRLSPAGLMAGIGVPDESLIFVAGSSTYQPNLGFSADELDPLDWTGDITLTLTGWTLPTANADFALYLTNLADTTVTDIVFSTHDPASTALGNSFTITPGDHLHFQFGFTELGNYDLELTWTGTHVAQGAISTTDTFRIQAIPEPSSFALLGLALGLAGFHRKR